MKKRYDKLVRDKIPEIIQKDNKIVKYEKMNKEEHLTYLNRKLKEELEEYYESEDLEELADLVEVVYGILDVKNIKLEEFENIRVSKNKKRGSFKAGIKLIEVEDIR